MNGEQPPFALSGLEGRFPTCFDFAQHERKIP